MSELIDHLTSLTRLRDADVLDSALAELARDLMRCEGVAIHRLVHDGQQQRWMTTAQMQAEEPGIAHLPSPPPDVERAPLREARPLWLDCLARQQLQPLPGPGYCWAQPLTEASGVPSPGVIEFVQQRPLAAEQLRMMGSLLRFYRQLTHLIDENERDGLTGLLNRKTFDESFVRAAQGLLPGGRAGQAGGWWLGLVDIDHFKRVNDTHGHLIGDEVLLLTAQLMRTSCRLGDRLYRFGGEEFVVLLRAPDEPSAFTAFERLRRRIEAHEFPQVRQLTVSVGVTAVDPDDTPSSAFERADRAVYEAKQAGRNRTHVHAAPSTPTAGAEAATGLVEFF